MVKMAGGERLMILDRKEKGDKFYTLLHFDSNGNGDLTDDPVQKRGRLGAPGFLFPGGAGPSYFGPIEAAVQVAGTRLQPARRQPRQLLRTRTT